MKSALDTKSKDKNLSREERNTVSEKLASMAEDYQTALSNWNASQQDKQGDLGKA